jgi:hypothetical protein
MIQPRKVNKVCQTEDIQYATPRDDVTLLHLDVHLHLQPPLSALPDCLPIVTTSSESTSHSPHDDTRKLPVSCA